MVVFVDVEVRTYVNYPLTLPCNHDLTGSLPAFKGHI